jgi:hypothetical protein
MRLKLRLLMRYAGNNMKKYFFNFLYSSSVSVLIISAYVFCIKLFGFIISGEFLPERVEPFEGHGFGVSYTLFEKVSPLMIPLIIVIISFIGIKKIPAENKKIGWIIGISAIILLLGFVFFKAFQIPALA